MCEKYMYINACYKHKNMGWFTHHRHKINLRNSLVNLIFTLEEENISQENQVYIGLYLRVLRIAKNFF